MNVVKTIVGLIPQLVISLSPILIGAGVVKPSSEELFFTVAVAVIWALIAPSIENQRGEALLLWAGAFILIPMLRSVWPVAGLATAVAASTLIFPNKGT